MGTRLKLRICTWNVGNAQPPADLSAWLGVEEANYDIVVVGAQEANYGGEKSMSPTSVVSPESLADNFDASVKTNKDEISKLPSGPSSTTPASRLRKLSRVVRDATGTLKQSTIRKLRSKGTDRSGPVGSHGTDLGRSSSDEERQRDDNSDPDSIGSKQGIPFTVPVHNSTGDLKGRLRKAHTVLGPQAAAETAWRDEIAKPSQSFKGIDESLLVKRVQSSAHSSNSSSIRFASLDNPELGLKLHSDNNSSTDSNSTGSERGSNDEPSRGNSRTFDKRSLTNKSSSRNSNALVRLNESAQAQGEEEGSQNNNGTRRKFSQVIESSLPSTYHLVAKHHLSQIKLLIFVHERHKWRVTKTETMSEATGLGNVVGNKGGVAVKLTLDDTTFCFISSHLAAHEGAKFLQQRNEDVIEIMRNIERNKDHGLPAIHQFNHVFWLGDLNYRLDLKRVLPAAVTWSHQERWCYVVDLIANRRFGDLAQFDELVHEMELENVFGGFTEGRITFPPTFKVMRGKPYSSYQSLRVPSYCDRILWHSLPLHKNHIRLKEYNSVTDIDTSDHKPVYAVFDLVIPKPIPILPLPPPRDSIKCTMDFMKLRVHGLYEKKVELDESNVGYEVLDDGVLAVTTLGDAAQVESPSSHTRRVVHVDFHGGGLFIKEKPHRTEVPLKNGRVRECSYAELPKIALKPVKSLSDLTYKYVTVVFTRLGSKQGSSCVLPVANLIRQPGRHRYQGGMELTKYGQAVATVEVEVELVVSFETWIDSRNNLIKPKR